jgi:polysaccharide pyruvyl transferase WcaK-like protein
MERLGVRDSDSSVMADLAFLLPSPPRTSVVGSKVTVGLNIMNYHGWRRSDPPSIYASYLDNMARFVEWLASKGHAARIVLGQNPSDLFAVEDVERRLGYSLMTAEERQMGSFEEVMGALASTDIVVASRYHVQIAAVKVRRPVLSITYGPMNDALMQAVGLQDFIHHIERIDFARLTSQCDALLDQRIRYSSIVDANVTAIETNLPEQLHRFIFPFQRPEPSAGLPA